MAGEPGLCVNLRLLDLNVRLTSIYFIVDLVFFKLGPLDINMQMHAPSTNWVMPR